MIKPNFFIVGAPKCGTSAMNDFLGQHPDVFMAKKELHYFGKDLGIRGKLTEAEYLNSFQSAGEKSIIGEASVWYLFSESAAEEIKKFSPRAKILIMLRNPVDVVYSLHNQHLYDGNEDVLDIRAAISLDEERKKGFHLPDSIDFVKLPSYIDSALFYRQVKRYLDAFGRENVHVVLYDDFSSKTEEVFKETLRFLEVNPKVEINYRVVNPRKEIRSFYLHRLIKRPPRKLKEIMRVILPVKKIRHDIMKSIFKGNVRQNMQNKTNPDLTTWLRELFNPDIQLLSKIIERDLSAWMK